MKNLQKFLLAGAVLSAPLFAGTAHADEYCREYQKNIVVGGHYEQGYGTACQQPDGSWMIVNSSGTVDPFDELRRNTNTVIVSQQQPVYYAYGPALRPVTYYPRPAYYRPYYPRTTSLFFSFGNNSHGWNNGNHWGNGWNKNRWHHH